jgi:hypothetical protein
MDPQIRGANAGQRCERLDAFSERGRADRGEALWAVTVDVELAAEVERPVFACPQWTYPLTADDVAELDQALRRIQAQGLTVPGFGASDLPIPQLMGKLARFKDELNFGLGVLYIRGFPIERYSKDEASAIFWGLGMHLGKPWERNMRGHVLGDVIDEGKKLDDPSARGYQSSAGLEMHTDGADLVGLLCLKQAPVGGENRIVSGMAVFNKLVETRPDIAQHLLDTEFCIDWRNEERPGELPYHRGHIYERREIALTPFALTGYIFSAQRHGDVPRLTELNKLALETFQATANDPELAFSFTQEPGDMVFLNNHFHCHARTSFTDSDDPREKRHLRRPWLEAEEWAAHRPAVMSDILKTAESYWRNPDTSVRMWDPQ